MQSVYHTTDGIILSSTSAFIHQLTVFIQKYLSHLQSANTILYNREMSIKTKENHCPEELYILILTSSDYSTLDKVKNALSNLMVYWGWWPRPFPRKRNATRQNDWGGLTNSLGKKRSIGQRRKAEIHPSECWVLKNGKEREESLLKLTIQKQRKTTEWARLEISSRKLDTRGPFHVIKGQKWYELNRSRRY